MTPERKGPPQAGQSDAALMLTPTRRAALQIVADGNLEYATRTGSWEPKVGYRMAAWDWLAERGLIAERLDAEPVGRVLRLVPVDITEAGREALRDA